MASSRCPQPGRSAAWRRRATRRCDLIVALGGDGTTLAAIRAAAAAGRPVLGIACGSLGALTAVSAGDLAVALDRVAAGDWTARRLPALVVESPGRGAAHGRQRRRRRAPRRRAGGGERRASTATSSSASPATGWWSRRRSARARTTSPRADRCSRPASAAWCSPRSRRTAAAARRSSSTATSTLTVELEPGFGGARIELDGQIQERLDAARRARAHDHAAPRPRDARRAGDEETMLAGLRRRRVLLDSPRMLARETGPRADQSESGQPGIGARMAMLELVHARPDWMGALGVALTRPAGRARAARRRGSVAATTPPSARAGSPTTSRGCARRSTSPRANGLRGLGDTAAVAAWEPTSEAAGAAGPAARPARARRRRLPPARLEVDDARGPAGARRAPRRAPAGGRPPDPPRGTAAPCAGRPRARRRAARARPPRSPRRARGTRPAPARCGPAWNSCRMSGGVPSALRCS